MNTETGPSSQSESSLATGMNIDMAGLDLAAPQLAQSTALADVQVVPLPPPAQISAIPVSPGQTVELPVDGTEGLLARIDQEGNLAIVIDGRTIILRGYVDAVDQAPITIVTRDGTTVSVADIVAATDPNLDIITAAGPAPGPQPGPPGDTESNGNGIFVPFDIGDGPGGLSAVGTLAPTALGYKGIDDERREFTRDDDDDENGEPGDGGGGTPEIFISFDLLGGIINEDDLPIQLPRFLELASLVVSDAGTLGAGNDPFDTTDKENQNGKPEDTDGVDDNGKGADDDPEPTFSVATVTANFDVNVPGTLEVDLSTLPAGLTSGGKKIIYQEQPPAGGAGNGIVAFVDQNGNGKFDDDDRLVFDVKVQEATSDSVFTVKFTLYDNIDNAAPDLNGDGSPDLLGAQKDQLLSLPVKLTATDSIGGTDSAVLTLRTQDDVPVFGEVTNGEGGMTIVPPASGIVHDETDGVDGDADDQSPADPSIAALIDDLSDKAANAGFSPPAGDSPDALLGVAQKQISASFGADGPSFGSSRNSVFGAISGSGEDEHPFELFMIHSGKGATPIEDNKKTAANEGNLTALVQASNATITCDCGEAPVCVQQIDARTIVGYANTDEGKKLVFVLSIDDQGVLTLVQYHQINHPQAGVTPEAHDDSFSILAEDGVTPLVFVRASDGDGDHAVQPVKIQIQDDGPLALDDVDSVDELGIATGNVVTGSDALNAIKDANATDGIADAPGVDAPHVISKLEHGGQTYTLVDNGDGTFSAQKNGGPLGAGESFDGAKLTIPTGEGGIFEIVLVSPDQGDVGNYKYTAPEQAGTSQTILAGATDLANSIALVTAGADAFATAFSSKGVTLTAIGGTLAVKTVNVVPKNGTLGPEDYGGIGVASAPGEEAEVDNNGPDEQMQMQFATPTDNARITFGTFFDGQQFDSGNQEIVRWEAYDGATLVASGLILGVNNGLAVLDVDTDGATFDRIVLKPIDNGAGNTSPNNSDFVLLSVEAIHQAGEDFQYTLRDTDGDESSATLHIGLDDVGPVGGAGLSIVVDEDGLDPTGTLKDGVGDSAIGDAEEALGAPNAAQDDAAFVGKIPFTAGADSVSIELTVEGGDTGLFTLAGKSILAAWDPEEHELVGFVAGRDPSDAVNRIFVMEVTNDQTGAFTFTLLQPIKHPDGDNENAVDPSFTVSVQIDDKGGNAAYTTVTVTIDDDMPVARADTDVVATDGTTDGNVITGAGTTSGAGGADSPGADGATVSQISGKNGATTDGTLDINGFLEVAGDHGVLKIEADGSYQYQPDGSTTSDTSDVFTYTLKDGDGDVSSATLTITGADLFVDSFAPSSRPASTDLQIGESLANLTNSVASGNEP